MNNEEDSWLKWSKRVLTEIEHFNEDLLVIEKKLEVISDDIVFLNDKTTRFIPK